jgi:hypothetical protein
MVLAGQARLCDFGHDFAHDAARRFLQEDVIPNVILSHVVARNPLRPYHLASGGISRTKQGKLE